MDWQANSSLPAPTGVDLWVIDLHDAVAQSEWVQERHCLSPAEQDRAARFRRPQDRDQYQIAHTGLRLLLARYLGLLPGAVPFEINPEGKPQLAPPHDAHLAFNLSHCDGQVLYAITAGTPVGVDVEFVKPNRDLNGMMRTIASPAEQAAYAALPEPDRRDAFYRLWVQKEAYIKARGDGLRYPLQAITTALTPGTPNALLKDTQDPTAPTAWQINSVIVPNTHRAAVATKR
jgi:4'-phosphopantetheinyl transferase